MFERSRDTHGTVSHAPAAGAGAGVTKAPGMCRDSNGNPKYSVFMQPAVRPSLQTIFNCTDRFDLFESCPIIPTTWLDRLLRFFTIVFKQDTLITILVNSSLFYAVFLSSSTLIFSFELLTSVFNIILWSRDEQKTLVE